MPTTEETLRALREGAISLDEAERRLASLGWAGAEATPSPATPSPSSASPSSPAPSVSPAAQAARLASGPPQAEPALAPADRRRTAGRVAVIGMSGRYAGAEDLSRFWENLVEARCSIREIPASRWDVRPYFRPLPIERGKVYCTWMGMMEDVELFDPLFFNISPTEAEAMDPQQRVFLQEAYRALEDAGHAGRSASGSRCGVYLGIMGNEYLTMLHQHRAGAADTTGTSFAIAAARLSYFLDLKGPALAIDTACSSSLVATHLACQALLGGEIDLAVAGGVSLYLSPLSYLGMCSAGMLSPDGRCRAFDDHANGFVPGEGAGALVLKRLEDAEADGDAIYGVIAGSAVNQDGRTNGITAPSMKSQLAVAREVYQRTGIDPGEVDYVEMHGTGTKLGDPVELEALSAAFKERTARRRYCAIGSVKSNIGHASAAAGVASVHKVLLSLRHGQLPPTLHVERPNEHFDFEDSPFVVNTELRAWAPLVGRPRRAGVSSFGFSGTNAHLVIEEYRRPAGVVREPRMEEALLFVLSARTAERLRAVARQMGAWLEAQRTVELADLAFTLQVGRQALEHRLAVVARTREELLAALRGAADGDTPASVLVGHLKRSKDETSLLEDDEDVEALMGAWLAKRKLSKLARAWLRGLEVDWPRLYGQPLPRRLHLPGYPFARERCWIPEAPAAALPAPDAPRLAAVLHPLVHQNVSDLSEQRYTSLFSGREFFLEDHQVEGRRVMPAAALLEMARAAAADAWKAEGILRLEGVTWSAPLVVDAPGVQVDVRLTPEGDEAIGFEIASRPPSGDTELVVHSRGRVALEPLGAAPTVALDAVRARCGQRTLSQAECYQGFEAAGIHYGPAHRGVESLAVGDGEVLASLILPTAADEAADRFGLHPSLLDSALQACAGLVGEVVRDGRLALPSALEGLEVFGPSSQVRWAHARRGPSPAEATHCFDVDLVEAGGRVAARLHGFTVRVVDGGRPAVGRPAGARREAPDGLIDGAVTLAPVWDPVAVAVVEGASAGSARVVIIGAGEPAAPLVVPWARAVDLPWDEPAEALAARIEALGPIEHLVWLAPAGRAGGSAGAGVLEAQAAGVVRLFRLVKAVMRAGYAERPLEWTVITVASHRVHPTDAVDPAHAGVHALFGSLAKEQPRWRVRLVDLEAGGASSAAEVFALPTDPLGCSWARRGGQWLQRKLVPAQVPNAERSAVRPGGTYVVVGGAGGLGEVWTEHVLRTHQANVVWIGRRALDPAIQGKIDRLGALGPAPSYLQADAKDPVALGEAYQAIKQRFTRIHGVVVSTIDLSDMSVAKMDEAAFRRGLSAKVDVAVQVAELFRNDTLDFLLFFSSVQSFQNAPGQANYAAGCAFSDAFAHHLAREWPCAVKVMNWGYWGGHGVVATSAHQARMAQAGIGSIEPIEGMQALEALMAGPLDQLAFLKTTRPVRLEGVDLGEVLEVQVEAGPGGLADAPGDEAGGRRVAALAARHRAEMDGLTVGLVGAQLAAAGLDEDAVRAGGGARVSRAVHRRWLVETAAFLGLDRPGAPPFPRGEDREALWQTWTRRRAQWSEDPDRRAQVRLLEVMLRGLPDILAGRRLATEVMFPASSLELVEGIYRGNGLADYFNEVAADAVAAAVARAVERAPSAGARPGRGADARGRSGLRILEIGGGTGGTTAAVLGRLERWSSRIDEYCFTDVSEAFLDRAQATWGHDHRYFSTRRLDIEAPLEEQGVALGAYDVVLAANVLHATRSIRTALRHLKAALKRGGLLAAIEISQKTLFTHLTVGLLDGWWLHDEPGLRIPGCPGLTPERWERLVAEEGFTPAVFPARAAHDTGQQVVLAQSDGVVRRRASRWPTPAVERPPAAQAPTLPAVPAPERPGALLALDRSVSATIVQALAEALKVREDALDADDAFSNYGVDSISGVRLVQMINQRLSIDLTPTDLFDHGSVNRLAAHIAARFSASMQAQGRSVAQTVEPVAAPASTPGSRSLPPVEPPAPPAPAPRSAIGSVRARSRLAVPRAAARGGERPARPPIAIIGMSGRFAHSADLEALWRHLAAGDDLVDEVTRWDLGRVHPHGVRHRCRRGSFIEDIDRFDPLFFKIAANEATYMDPQQRLFLEEAWKALEDAGHAGERVGGRACGVYVGCSGSDYQMLFGEEEVPAQAFWGNADSIVPARIAYHLDLKGPAVAVDTACSSSLVAVHLACQGLWSGETEMALAGGVFLNATPWFYRAAERAGMLSPEGRCHAFDERADGFVPGEGVGAVVLKPLDAALADGDFIHGVISGSGINQDGATNGITAPSARSQELLERGVYQSFAIDPGGIQLVEAHGTGTRLGDPIEVDALTRAFRAFTDKRGTCALGSIKSNIGHATAAAGIAGLLKVLLALRHRQLPPSIHFERVNPGVRLDDSPFYVNTVLRPWEVAAGERRRAAVSSFGFSGTNAHLVVEEAPPARRRAGSKPGYLVALSARTPEQLKRQAERLAAHCEGAAIELGDVSRTLLEGRRHLDHRLACVAADRSELVEALRGWLTPGGSSRLVAGEAASSPEERARWSERATQAVDRCRASGSAGEYLERLAAVGECFANGAALDPVALFDGERCGRVPLPTYPFARDRYWVPVRAAAAEGSRRLHPLVGRNVSTLFEERFTTRLTWDDFFVAQHRIGGRAILPGVAFLELARAAGALATERSISTLRDVAWLKPVIVPEDGLELGIALEPDASGHRAAFEVTSGHPGAEREVHARGTLVFGGEAGPEAPGERLELEAISARCTGRRSDGEVYDALRARGLDLGPALRSVRALAVGDGEVLATLELPGELPTQHPELVLHPAVMDGALQAGIGTELGAEPSLYLPFAIEEVEVRGAVPTRGFAHFQLRRDGAGRRADVRIADQTGEVRVVMRGLVARPVMAPLGLDARAAGGRATLRFERTWEASELGAGGAEPRAVTTLVIDRRRRLFEGLTDGPGREEGGRVLLATPGASFQALGGGAFSVRPEVESDFDRLFGELEVDPRIVRLVHAGSSGGPPSAVNGARRSALLGEVEEVFLGLLHALRAAGRRFPGVRLEVIALAPMHGDGAAPHQAAISGLLLAAGVELSRLTWKTVELPGEGESPEPALQRALEEIRAGAGGEAEISYRGGERRRATWTEVPRTAPAERPGMVRPGGVYLITGGLGALGSAAAMHLARQAPVRLALCGRATAGQAAEARLAELRRLGAEALYLQADVSRPEEVERLIGEVKARFGAIHGVIHAAGITRDALLAKKTREELDSVVAPKVLGTVFLDEATRGEPLEFFVSFSSAAAVLGNAGQSDYAYANAFMDAYVVRRAALVRRGERSGRSLSIDWPVWREGGLKVNQPQLELMRAATGMSPLETTDGLVALEELLERGEGQVLLLSGEPARLRALVAGRGWERSDRREDVASTGSSEDFERALLGLAAKVVGLEAGQLSPEKSLVEYGFDSLSFGTLAERMGAELGVTVSPATFFEFPTARSLASHLAPAHSTAVADRARERAEPPDAPVSPSGQTTRARFASAGDDRRPRGARTEVAAEPVAIVGLAARLPRSPSLESFWEHLAAGDDLVTEVPPERWEAGGFAAALASAGEPEARLWGGFLDEVDTFDAPFFGISRREAELMDPQQRIFLEVAWQAVEDAGYRMSELGGTRTGVFVGASTADYGDVVRASGVRIEGHMATGLAPSVLANRVSYLFDLRGPSEPVDTACSSALVALHRAAEAIASRRCELAIAGGVNVLLTPSVFISFIKAGMLSPDGRCKTFDQRANGYVRGEGAGAVLLKPLGQAVRDRDHIYAVIRGTAVNHGGRASSLTAPRVAAQAEVLAEAYRRAEVDPATVGYIEAHGTGTALGDPIEVDALKRAFSRLFERRGQAPSVGSCGLGSVKANVGHLEAAAGMAGLVKVLLSMAHRTLPPAVHFATLNPYIQLEGSPFYVVERPTPWEPPRDAGGHLLPRRAGVSSFGFGGANAHLVLEEHATAEPSAFRRPSALHTSPLQVVPLSAKSEERLKAYAEALWRHLARLDGAVDLADLAYTLQVGREPFAHRLAVLAATPAELAEKLEAFHRQGVGGPGVFTGRASPSGATAVGQGVDWSGARPRAQRDLEALAVRWVEGGAVDWGRWTEERPPRRLSLPTYPFARERYWLDAPERAAGEARPMAAAPREVVDDGPSWRVRLAAPGVDRRTLLESLLAGQIARMLKLGDDERLDRRRPLVALGFDSLMALQLRKLVGVQLELDLSLIKLLGGESTEDLAERIFGALSGSAVPALEGSLPAVPYDDMLEGAL